MYVKPIDDVLPNPNISMPWDEKPIEEPSYFAMPPLPDLKHSFPTLFEEFVSPVAPASKKAQEAAKGAAAKAAESQAQAQKKRHRDEDTEAMKQDLAQQKRKLSMLIHKLDKPQAATSKPPPTVRSKKGLRKIQAKRLFQMAEGYMPKNIYKAWPDWAIQVMRRDPKMGYSEKQLKRMAVDLSDCEEYDGLIPFCPGNTDWHVRESGFYEEYWPRLKENAVSSLDNVAQYREPAPYDNTIDCM